MNLWIERARLFTATAVTSIKLRVGRVPVLVWVIAALLVIGPVLIWLGYTQDWIGLRAYTDPKGDYHPAKTLWDWMELLIIPIVLAVGGFLLGQAGRQAGREAADRRADTERRIADDRNRDATLQNYLDKMADLLLGKSLPGPEAPSLVRDTARAQMVATLRQLDATRRNVLFGFLRQTGLMGGDGPVRILAGADLSGADLSGADLSQADLSGSNLSKADLSRSTLSGATLSRATLSRASLIQADLSKADLKGADLRGAELSMAKARAADLSGANLSRAWVSLIGPDTKSGSLAFTADLSGADLSLATLRGADLSGADLNCADLSEADLTEGTLRDADLTAANLRGANLCSAVLSRAALSGANLSGARYDDVTRWPEGFTPPPVTVKVELVGEEQP